MVARSPALASVMVGDGWQRVKSPIDKDRGYVSLCAFSLARTPKKVRREGKREEEEEGDPSVNRKAYIHVHAAPWSRGGAHLGCGWYLCYLADSPR